MQASHTTDGGVHEGRREVKWSLALLVAVVALAVTGASRGRPTGLFLVDFLGWLGGAVTLVAAALSLARRRRALRRQWGSPAGTLLRNLTCALAGAVAIVALINR